MSNTSNIAQAAQSIVELASEFVRQRAESSDPLDEETFLELAAVTAAAAMSTAAVVLSRRMDRKRLLTAGADKEHEESNLELADRSKRRRISSGHDTEALTSEARIDPYTTLPFKTVDYIQLRLKLARFKGVFRVVQFPLTFTFANLHQYIMFLFGWNGSHSHQAEVFSNVVMYAASNKAKAGDMKKYGRVPPPNPTLPAEFPMFVRADQPIFSLRKRFGRELGYSTVKEDSDLTLSEVWCHDEEKNTSEGECTNQEIGVKYEYDLGARWEVHITCETNEPFLTVRPSSNIPIIVKACGAPPIEDASDSVDGELEGEDKNISQMLFAKDSFLRYCKGEIGTEARKKELAVFVWEEERARRVVEKVRLLQERRERIRQERVEQNHGKDEEDSDEYDSDE